MPQQSLFLRHINATYPNTDDHSSKSKLRYFFSVLDSNDNLVLQQDDFIVVADRISDGLGYGQKSRARSKIQLKASRLYVQMMTDLGKEDGGINLAEWMNFFEYFNFKQPEYIKRYIERIVNYIFSLFDLNFDMHINRQEYSEMFKAYSIDPQEARIGFEKLDKNTDEFISKEELIQGCYDFFLSSDPKARGNWIFGNWSNRPLSRTA